MVLVTRQAPDFTAAAVLGNGEIVEKFNFKQHTSGKATVLFFWPMDFTLVGDSTITSLLPLAATCGLLTVGWACGGIVTALRRPGRRAPP